MQNTPGGMLGLAAYARRESTGPAPAASPRRALGRRGQDPPEIDLAATMKAKQDSPALAARRDDQTDAARPDQMTPVINRIKRAQGQLAGVLRLLEEGRDCEDVVTQLAAVSKALDRAGFAIVASGLQQCLVAGDGDIDSLDVKKMEKLFLSLA